MKNVIISALMLAMVFAGTVNAQTRIVNDVDVNTTWTVANSPYILDGYIFVTDGATLTIEPGVVVRGMDDDPANNVLPGGVAIPAGQGGSGNAITDNDDRVGALIVSTTGRLVADGTAANPIIFTAAKDDLTDNCDLSCADFGLWGGLIILGEAIVSSPLGNDSTGLGFVQNTIEGVVTDNPTTAALSVFGGTDDNDDSGILRYVSIRHGGDVLTDGDEINGLTLGGVGRGTTIDFVEVLANADDGIEWFGGTVDVKHAIVTCVVDDSYDYDQGARFRGQFLVTVGTGNRLGEHDGGDNPDQAGAFNNGDGVDTLSTPVVFNHTYIGKAVAAGEQEVIVFRDFAGGNYKNGVFFQSQQGLEVELRFDRPSSNLLFSRGIADPAGVLNGQALDISDNAFCNINGAALFLNAQTPSAPDQDRALSNANGNIGILAALPNNNNIDGGACIPVSANNVCPNSFNPGTFDLRTTAGPGSGDFSGSNSPAFFETANYRGAIDPATTPGTGWYYGWTATQLYGIIE